MPFTKNKEKEKSELQRDAIIRVVRIRYIEEDYRSFEHPQVVPVHEDYMLVCETLQERATSLLMDSSAKHGQGVHNFMKNSGIGANLLRSELYGRAWIKWLEREDHHVEMDEWESAHMDQFWIWFATRRHVRTIHAGFGAEFPLMEVFYRSMKPDEHVLFGQYNIGFYVCETYALRRYRSQYSTC